MMGNIQDMFSKYLPQTPLEYQGFRRISFVSLLGFILSVSVALSGRTGRSILLSIIVICGFLWLYTAIRFAISHFWMMRNEFEAQTYRKVIGHGSRYYLWFSMQAWGWAFFFSALSVSFCQ